MLATSEVYLPCSCCCLLALLTFICLLFEGGPVITTQHLNSAVLKGTEYLSESSERKWEQKGLLHMLHRTWTHMCSPGWGRMRKSKLQGIAYGVGEACRNLQENLRGRVKYSCWTGNPRYAITKKKKPKCCSPKRCFPTLQRKFGKLTNGHRKVKRMTGSIFPTPLKARIVLVED